VAQPILVKIKALAYPLKNSLKRSAASVVKKLHVKVNNHPMGERKFAQSGHPGCGSNSNLGERFTTLISRLLVRWAIKSFTFIASSINEQKKVSTWEQKFQIFFCSGVWKQHRGKTRVSPFYGFHLPWGFLCCFFYSCLCVRYDNDLTYCVKTNFMQSTTYFE
jgi:hypothetical protein